MPKQAPTPAKPAIQTEAHAGIIASAFLKSKARVEALDAAEKAEIDSIRQRYAERRKDPVAQRDENFARVHAWAEANRNERKTIRLPNGRELWWRNASKPKLVVVAGKVDAIIQILLKRHDRMKFLKIDLKRDGLAAAPKVVEATEGLSLERGEYFSIH